MREPSINAYAFVGNNPLSYVDPDGNFRIPTEFRNAYPNLTRYIEENLYQQLNSDERFFNTMREAFALGNFSAEFADVELTKELFVEMFSKNSGPTLIATRAPWGNPAAKGYTDSPGGSYIRPLSELEINLNSVLLQGVEDALADENRSATSKRYYLFILLQTLLHEPLHAAEISLTGEMVKSVYGSHLGDEFTKMMWGETREMKRSSEYEGESWYAAFIQNSTALPISTSEWCGTGIDHDSQAYKNAGAIITILEEHQSERAETLPTYP
ncbi:hypothetical protein GCM10011318_09120 [Phaeocystidibacter marisrubri]|nr:hypothetical protein GCM10011318_09120 [Phaeocystidibacter marisrubri]